MEYTQKRWVCDHCKRDVKRGVMPPAGWLEFRVDFYGNMIHYCPDAPCIAAMNVMYRDNSIVQEQLRSTNNAP